VKIRCLRDREQRPPLVRSGDRDVSQPNPYEAPRSTLSPPLARPLTARDRKVAARMILAHEQGGYTVGLFYRWSAARYVVLCAYFGVILLVLALFELWPLLALALGALLGVLLRDLGWARASATTWHLTERVTDWEKVRQIAEGESQP
jgi:hypothetical protein